MMWLFCVVGLVGQEEGGRPDDRRSLKRLKVLNWATLASELGSTQVSGSGVTTLPRWMRCYLALEILDKGLSRPGTLIES